MNKQRLSIVISKIYSMATVLTLGFVIGLIQKSAASVTTNYSSALTINSPMPLIPTARRTARSTTIVTSFHSGILSSNSLRFSRPNGNSRDYYYRSIYVTVSTNGNYYFTSNSTIDTYGCFYQYSFTSSSSSNNLISCNDDGDGNNQFRISAYLVSGSTYILVVTTHSSYVTGNFLIKAVGPAVAGSSWVILQITQSSSVVSSLYSVILSSSSPTFTRSATTSGSYYYQAIQVSVYMNGNYSFTSNSSMDTYGYFYLDYFNPYFPSNDLIISNDDGGSDRQFKIDVRMVLGRTYILVVTTHGSYVTGNILITAVGPGMVGLSWFRSSTTDAPCSIYGTCNNDNKKKTLLIVCVTLGSVVLCLIIIVIYVCKRKHRTPRSTTENNLPVRNQNAPANAHPVAYIGRNAIITNVVQMPYTISMGAVYTTNNVEQPPPSYDVAVLSVNPQGR